jgi:hypothetical protein
MLKIKTKQEYLISFYFIISLIIIVSCGKSKEELEKESLDKVEKNIYDKNQKIQERYKNKNQQLIKKYNAVCISERDKFTYELQNELIQNKRLLSIGGLIDDIVKYDSVYYFVIEDEFIDPISKKLISSGKYKLKMYDSDFLKIKNQIKKDDGCDYSFIVNVDSINIETIKEVNKTYIEGFILNFNKREDLN